MIIVLSEQAIIMRYSKHSSDSSNSRRKNILSFPHQGNSRYLKLHSKFNQLERSGKFFLLPSATNECFRGGRVPVPEFPDFRARVDFSDLASCCLCFATISPGSGNTVCQLSAHLRMRSTLSAHGKLANIKSANWQMVAIPGAPPCLARVTVSTALM